MRRLMIKTVFLFLLVLPVFFLAGTVYAEGDLYPCNRPDQVQIGQVNSSYTCSADANGCSLTAWAQYQNTTDGDGDGIADPNNPGDQPWCDNNCAEPKNCPSNYCTAAGYHECTVGAPAPQYNSTCVKNGQTGTAFETYECNFGGKTYCGPPFSPNQQSCVYEPTGSCTVKNWTFTPSNPPPNTLVNVTVQGDKDPVGGWSNVTYKQDGDTNWVSAAIKADPGPTFSFQVNSGPTAKARTVTLGTKGGAVTCSPPGPYTVGAGGGITEVYVEPNPVPTGTRAKIIATGPTSCSTGVDIQSGAGLTGCNMSVATCSGGNPKDSNPCWWQWDCNAGASGSYTASFTAAGNSVCNSSAPYSVGGSTSTPSPSPSPSFAPTGNTVSFRVAEKPDDLSKAEWQDYTTEPMPLDFEFKDKTPGIKFVWVEFKDTKGKVERRSAQIQLLGGDPVITSCLLGFEGNNTIVNLTGQNFGSLKGTVKSDETLLQIKEWKADKVKLIWPNAPQGQTLPIILTNTDGQIVEGQCNAISQLSVGAKVFCRQPSGHQTQNVALSLAGKFAGGILTRQKVNIDQEGVIQGLTQKLEAGRDYQLSLKAPKSLRTISEVFTAEEGTTNISNFVLPVGDIFPLDGGDSKINSLDKSELNRQFVLTADICNRTGDFNKDCRVNSVDWACMRASMKDAAGRGDDPEPVAGGPVSSSTPTPSGNPSECNPPVICTTLLEGCTWEGGDSCNCGTLVCAPSPSSSPSSSPTSSPSSSPNSSPGTQTITIPVSSNLDDATEEQSNGNIFAGRGTILEFGSLGGAPRNVGLRFANIPNLAGATIISADLLLYAGTSDGGSFTGTWYGQDTAASNSFINCDRCRDISSRPRTTATAGGNDTNFGSWTSGNQYTLTGFGPIVQELVNKYGNPSSITLMHIYSGGSGARVTPRYIYQPTNAAKLKITYEVAKSSGL